MLLNISGLASALAGWLEGNDGLSVLSLLGLMLILSLAHDLLGLSWLNLLPWDPSSWVSKSRLAC